MDKEDTKRREGLGSDEVGDKGLFMCFFSKSMSHAWVIISAKNPLLLHAYEGWSFVQNKLARSIHLEIILMMDLLI